MKALEFGKPRWLEEGVSLLGGYDAFIDSFEVKIIAYANIGDYQGDYHYLLYDKNNGEYAYLCIGYGSCSGCDQMDSMQDGGSTAEEFTEWRDEIWNSLEWKTKPDILAWLRSDARSRDFRSYYDDGEWPVFLAECIAKLSKKKVVKRDS